MIEIYIHITAGGDEVDRVHSESGRDVHVLTYEDEEGDWLMVGDVPWE